MEITRHTARGCNAFKWLRELNSFCDTIIAPNVANWRLVRENWQRLFFECCARFTSLLNKGGVRWICVLCELLDGAGVLCRLEETNRRVWNRLRVNVIFFWGFNLFLHERFARVVIIVVCNSLRSWAEMGFG